MRRGSGIGRRAVDVAAQRAPGPVTYAAWPFLEYLMPRIVQPTRSRPQPHLATPRQMMREIGQELAQPRRQREPAISRPRPQRPQLPLVARASVLRASAE